MNFKEQLVDSGKIVGEIVASNVGNNPEYYKQILDMTLFEKMPMQSRAGRVLSICTLKYPYLFEPHIDRVLKFALEDNGFHRNVFWVFAEVDIKLTEEQEGILLDLCFEWLNNKQLEIAPTVFCFTIIFKIVKKIPELGPELAEVIKSILPTASAGVKNRGLRIIKAMKKMGAIQ